MGLGELLKGIPKDESRFNSERGSLKETTSTLPPGIDKRTSHQAQTIAEKAVIYAEAKLGELLRGNEYRGGDQTSPKRSLPSGVTHKTSHQARPSPRTLRRCRRLLRRQYRQRKYRRRISSICSSKQRSAGKSGIPPLC